MDEQFFGEIAVTEALLRQRKAQFAKALEEGRDPPITELEAITRLELRLANARALRRINEVMGGREPPPTRPATLPQAIPRRPRGVWYETAKGKWRATVRIDGRRRSLGHFTTEQEALNAVEEHERLSLAHSSLE